MRLKVGLALLLALTLLTTAPLYAQDNLPPGVREAAIRALNVAVPNIGQPDSWRYEIVGQTNVSTLGCPTAVGRDLGYTVTTYRIWLNYDNTEYLYYVSQDAALVQPCDPKIPASGSGISTQSTCHALPGSGELPKLFYDPSDSTSYAGDFPSTGAPVLGKSSDSLWLQIDVANTPVWVTAASVTLDGACASLPVTGQVTTVQDGSTAGACPANYQGYLLPRLIAGGVGQVVAGGNPNRVRQNPSTLAPVVYQMNPETQFSVISGPQCGEGIVWWNVSANNQTGWTAESQNGIYYLEPLDVQSQPAILPVTGTIIDGTSFGQMRAIETIQQAGFAPVAVGWNTDGSLLAVQTTTGLQFFVYPGLQPMDEYNQIFVGTQEGGDMLTTFAFSPDGKTLAVGYTSGTILLFDLSTRTLQYFDAHQVPVSALDFSLDSGLLASAANPAPGAAGSSELGIWDVSGTPSGKFFQMLNEPIYDVSFDINESIPSQLGLVTSSSMIIYDFYESREIYHGALTAPGSAEPRLVPADLSLLNVGTNGFFYNDGSSVYAVLAQTSSDQFGTPLDVYDLTSGPVVAFAPSRTASSTSPSVLVLGSGTDLEISNVPYSGGLLIFTGGTIDIAFNPEGNRIATVSANNSQVVIYGIP